MPNPLGSPTKIVLLLHDVPAARGRLGVALVLEILRGETTTAEAVHRLARSSHAPSHNEQGEIGEWLGTASNVTEQKRSEDASRGAEEA